MTDLSDERDELYDEIRVKSYLISLANKRKLLAIIDEMLQEPQIDPEAVREVETKNDIVFTPLTDSGTGNTWLEEKFIPKTTKKGTKLYGPYLYEYRWENGRRKFVKYHGKVKKS